MCFDEDSCARTDDGHESSESEGCLKGRLTTSWWALTSVRSCLDREEDLCRSEIVEEAVTCPHCAWVESEPTAKATGGTFCAACGAVAGSDGAMVRMIQSWEETT